MEVVIVRFDYKTNNSDQKVILKGSWDDWKRNNEAYYHKTDRCYRLELTLPTNNSYEYGWEVEGKWVIDNTLPQNGKNNTIKIYDFQFCLQQLKATMQENIENQNQNILTILSEIIKLNQTVKEIKDKIDELNKVNPNMEIDEPSSIEIPQKSIQICTFRTSSCLKNYPNFEKILQDKLQILFNRYYQENKKSSWFKSYTVPTVLITTASNITAVPKDVSLIFCCGFTASARLDAETILPFKKELQSKFPKAIIVLLVFRFGEAAQPAKVKDNSDCDVENCLNFSFSSNGWLDTPLSSSALDYVWKTLSSTL